MTGSTTIIFATLLLLPQAPKAAQGAQTAAPAPTPAAAAPSDAVVTAAEDLIGKALFLRGFYLSNNLSYDAAGRVEGAPRAGDWTLAAMNVLKATRQGADAIELEGVRVAIRYNPDAHEFQRHPLNDEKMKVLVKLAMLPAGPQPGLDASVHQLRAAFTAIFAIGIDPALQRSMPPLWSHYFDPSRPWAPDALTGQTVYQMLGQSGQPEDVTAPLLAHRVDPRFTDFAARDKVKGSVQLRVVVDAQGFPQRITVTRPLGYGLEQEAADTVARWRFEPAIRAGAPVASAIAVNLDFETAPPR